MQEGSVTTSLDTAINTRHVWRRLYGEKQAVYRMINLYIYDTSISIYSSFSCNG